MKRTVLKTLQKMDFETVLSSSSQDYTGALLQKDSVFLSIGALEGTLGIYISFRSIED